MIQPDTLQRCKLLLVDDEEANLDLLEAILEMAGYRSTIRASDARTVMALYEEHHPDLVLLDLHMPYRSGFELLGDLRARVPADDYVPVLVLTADVTSEAMERALSSGARDFLTKPFDTVEVVLRVKNLLEARLLHRLQREARGEAEDAQARSALLAEVSRVLGSSLDGTTSLAQIPALLAPRWAEAAAVLTITEESILPVAAAHADASRLDGLAARMVAGLGARVRERAAWGERSMVVAGRPDRAEAPPTNKLLAPIRVRGSADALLVLERPGSAPAFSADERELIEEIAARAGLALENARLFAEAERATRSRDRMLSVVAHDLRNPLAVVGMYGEMLLSMLPPDGDEYSRGALTSIHQTTQRMQRMVEDLLDVSSLEQGAFSLRRAEQPLEPLLLEAERMLRPLAESKGIELSFQGDGDGKRRALVVDGARLIQLLSNLVGNALKFTPAGGSIRLSAERRGDAVCFAVADTGAGITAEQIPHIFGRFWQAADEDRRGIGLGLSIVRGIVDAHGGRVWVESEVGRGSTFYFGLPAVLDPAALRGETGPADSDFETLVGPQA